jgi:RNA polymerase sigma-70 factor (ECF subfamily)
MASDRGPQSDEPQSASTHSRWLSSGEFEKLRTSLRKYGRGRFPALHADIEDLTSQTLSDLWEYLDGRPAGQAVDAATVRKLAFSIFGRRAVDVFRKSARQWAVGIETLTREEQTDQRSDADARSRLLERMLQVCVAELADVPEADRALLALATGTGPDRKRAMDARERQRLKRLRQRLSAAIRSAMGEDAKSLLREDF